MLYVQAFVFFPCRDVLETIPFVENVIFKKLHLDPIETANLEMSVP